MIPYLHPLSQALKSFQKIMLIRKIFSKTKVLKFGTYVFVCVIYCFRYYIQAFDSFLGFLKILFIYFQRRGKEGKREGEKHQCVVASHTPPTGDLAHNPGICPDWKLNRQPFGCQTSTQSTDPHQPDQMHFEFMGTNSSLVSFLCVWLSNFPSTIYRRGFLFSFVCFWLLCCNYKRNYFFHFFF